jgi:hypothetical protein
MQAAAQAVFIFSIRPLLCLYEITDLLIIMAILA